MVEIHDQRWNLGYVQAQAQRVAKFAFRKRKWEPLDVLIEEETHQVCFDTNPLDDPRFQLVMGGWPRDWCLICSWGLNAEAGEEHSIGYTNGREWLCVECYEKFFNSKSQEA